MNVIISIFCIILIIPPNISIITILILILISQYKNAQLQKNKKSLENRGLNNYQYNGAPRGT